MKDFTKLKVWEKAHSITLTIYQTTASYPKDELFGLTSQTRRACVSIPSNIAEGCGRDGDAEFGRFLQIAKGSASELQYHLLLATELGYLDKNTYKELASQVSEVKKMLTVLVQKTKEIK